MKLILVRWSGNINGSKYTIHETESYSDFDIHSAIDLLGDPQDTDYVELSMDDVPSLGDKGWDSLSECGYLDSASLSRKLGVIWENTFDPLCDYDESSDAISNMESELKEAKLKIKKLEKDRKEMLLRIVELNPCNLSREEIRELTSRPEQAPKRASYVYVMKDKANNLYKIGKSVNPLVREKTLQSEKPSIEMVFQCLERKDFSEKTLHARYSEQRVRGEWFNLTPSQVRYICNFKH